MQRCATEKIDYVGLCSRIQQHGDAGGAAAGAGMVKSCRALQDFSFAENVVVHDDKEG